MDVIETTTDDRKTEMRELFNKMKPFLEKGASYNKAYESVMGHKPSTTRAWWKELVKYGEKQGYPRRISSNANKYGLLNIHFSKKLQKWYYHYTIDNKRKFFTSYDLKKLRKKVEKNGLPWVVLDIEKAKETYAMNDQIQKDRAIKQKGRVGTGKPNKTGILYVSKLKKATYKSGFFWRYFIRKENIHISAKTLRELRTKVLEAGHPWYVLDKEKYQKHLDEEDVRMSEN